MLSSMTEVGTGATGGRAGEVEGDKQRRWQAHRPSELPVILSISPGRHRSSHNLISVARSVILPVLECLPNMPMVAHSRRRIVLVQSGDLTIALSTQSYV